MEVEIMINKVSQAQKDKGQMLFIICGSCKINIYINTYMGVATKLCQQTGRVEVKGPGRLQKPSQE
jgi:uncharacterized CHY-type Zn-finger protein